jgi:hypothetical protein
MRSVRKLGKNIAILLTVMGVLVILGGCSEPEKNQLPKVSIISPTNGEYSFGESLTFSCDVSDKEDDLIDDTNITWLSDKDGVFGKGRNLDYSNLSLNQHNVTVSAVDSDGGIGNDEVVITIKSTVSTLVTNDISNITSNSATSGGQITSDGGVDITAKGVCWATSHTPTIEKSHSNDGSGSSDFNSNISDLLPNTTYYLRAYATNANGTAYGNELEFTTNADPVVLSTKECSNVTLFSVASGGIIENNGGATVTASGVCFSESPEPTLNNLVIQNPTNPVNFNTIIPNLSPDKLYYIRAFAENLAGVAYGNQIAYNSPITKFFDNFQNNNNNWYITDSEYILYGYFYLSFYEEGYYRRKLNYTDGFMFEDKFIIYADLIVDEVLDTTNSYFGFEWNYDYNNGSSTHRQFTLDNDGIAFIGDRINGTWDPNSYVGKKVTDGFTNGDAISIQVIKNGNSLRILVNETYDATMTTLNEPTATNGFSIVFSNIALRVDNIGIYDYSNNGNKQLVSIISDYTTNRNNDKANSMPIR